MSEVTHIAARLGSIVGFRKAFGLMHIRLDDYGYYVEHESRTGGSYAVLDRFGTRDEAVAYALSKLRDYSPCRLGEIVGC